MGVGGGRRESCARAANSLFWGLARAVPYSGRLIWSEPPRLPLQVTSVFKLPRPISLARIVRTPASSESWQVVLPPPLSPSPSLSRASRSASPVVPAAAASSRWNRSVMSPRKMH